VSLAEESARNILEVMREHDDPVPAPDVREADFSGQLRIRMPKSLHRELAAVADAEGVSLNQLMVMFLAKQLEAGRFEARAQPRTGSGRTLL
jgi:antitoxin HicB